MRYNIFILVLLIFCFSSTSFAQDLNSDKLKIAALPFQARAGIGEGDAATISQLFRAELVTTGSFVVLERERMEELLQEHVLNQLGASTKLAVEAGKILNVEKMVAGHIGKIGRKYSINVNLINVMSSQIEKSFTRSYSGEIEGIHPILQSIALEMCGKELRGISKTPMYILGGAALATFGTSIYSYFMAENSHDSYKEATTMEDLKKHKDDTQKFDKITLYSGIAAGGTAVLYYFYQKMYHKSLKPTKINANVYMPDAKSFGVVLKTKF